MAELLSVGAPTSRRSFFKRAGGGVAALAVVASGCDSDDPTDPAAVTLDFSNDFGVLNYAYALEQLEAAFYAQVIANAAFASIFSADEQRLMRDIAAHEAVHRDFLRTALSTNAIGNLTPNFSAVNFANKASVLGTARTFEDLGVAAYNGAGKYLQSDVYLTLAGKIVSVEARHAAAIRDVLQPRSAASVGEAGGGLPEVVLADGLDTQLPPATVLMMADPFIEQTITVRNA
jgi:hypothetical protein